MTGPTLLNYLVPIGARIRKELHVEGEAVNVALVLRSMEEARSRVNIVILDACRDNPFEGDSRSSFGRGLAPIKAPRGTIIAYSTSPDKVAEDGDSRNSPYTEELIRYIPEQGWKIEEILKKVRSSVLKKTNDRQMPWEATSLIGDFYFLPSKIEETIILFRNEPEVLSDTQVAEMLKVLRLFDASWNKSAMGIKHDYHLQQEDKIIYDKMTNLMWQQAGSHDSMSHSEAKDYIAKLNHEICNGYTDWRLPTLEEAMSLMENYRKNANLHIHSVFSNHQCWIWTADYASADMAWFVHFSDGLCMRNAKSSKCYVRAVRSVK